MIITKQIVRDKMYFYGPLTINKLYGVLDLKTSTEAKQVLGFVKELIDDKVVSVDANGLYKVLIELE